VRQELPHSKFVVNDQKIGHDFISKFRLPIANFFGLEIGNWKLAIGN